MQGAQKQRPPKLRRKAEREYRAVTPFTIATTARLPKQLRRQADRYADEHGVSVTQVICDALKEYLEWHGYLSD